MQVGIYFDLRNPPAWGSDPARLHGFTLEMCEEADSLGCHSIWLSEHHLFDDGYLDTAAHVRRRGRRPHPPCSHRYGHRHRAAAPPRRDRRAGRAGRPHQRRRCPRPRPRCWLPGAGVRSLRARIWPSLRRHRSSARRELGAVGLVTPAPVQDPLPIWIGYQGPKGARRAGQLGRGAAHDSRGAVAAVPPRAASRAATTVGSGGWRGASTRGSPMTPRGTGRSCRGTSPRSSTRIAGTWSRAPTSRSPARSTPKSCADATARAGR